ncbi:hypothetical protein FOZ63_019559, partial [Perkinsus olseni]
VMPPELVGEVMDYCGRPMLRMDGPSEMVYAKEGFFESRRATPHGLNIFHYPRARRIELRSSSGMKKAGDVVLSGTGWLTSPCSGTSSYPTCLKATASRWSPVDISYTPQLGRLLSTCSPSNALRAANRSWRSPRIWQIG